MHLAWPYRIILAALILGGCSTEKSKDLLSEGSSSSQSAAKSIDKLWIDLNDRAEKLDPQSSMNSLTKTKSEIGTAMSQAENKASKNYEALAAEYKRLDAAEAFKKLEAQVKTLKSDGKKIEGFADNTTSEINLAKAKYQVADREYERVKANLSSAVSGTAFP